MSEILSYYTQLPILFYILEQRRIVFGNPKYWEDKTDSKTLEKYANRKRKHIRTLCLTEFPKETYDNILHWKIYAPGKSGCRIDFDKESLEKAIKKHKNIHFERIDYLSIDKFKTEAVKMREKLFLLKHNSYASEKEWRAVWLGKLEKDNEFELDISEFFPVIINRIKLSPELPKRFAENMRYFLEKCFNNEMTPRHEMRGTKAIKSWIFENPEWERIVNKALTQKIGD